MKRTDVVVIGAGLAGLTCARDLSAGGADVTVLEARDVVGGRTPRVEAGGRTVDGGGELVGLFMTPFVELAAELGLELEESQTALPGEIVFLADGRRVVGGFEDLVGSSSKASHDAYERRLAEVAAGIDPARPWAHPDAAELDALSLADYARRLGADEGAIGIIRLHHLSLSVDAPERTSALSELRKFAAGGAYDYAAWESHRIAGGTFQLAERMAAGLGSRVRLQAPVTGISRVGAGVRIALGDGDRIEADACVSTIPGSVLHGVAIDGLSEPRTRALRRLRQARAAKIVAVYDSSFWRAAGLTGLSYSDRVVGSTWEQRDGVLSALVPPERLGYFGAMSAEIQRAEVLDHLAELFGEEARRPLGIWIRVWGEEPYTRGYVTQHAPGDLTAMGDLLAASEGPFHVAGSDFGQVAGYMTGAIESGHTAAARVLAG
jgi:monoamine oxidase